MRSGNTTEVPNAANILERSYSDGDAAPAASDQPAVPVDQLASSGSRPPVRRTQSAPLGGYCVPQPVALSPVPATKRAEKMMLTPPSRPNLEIEILRPLDEHDPELILLSPVHQRRNSAFHLAVRFHNFQDYCEGEESLTELICVKEVFEGTAVNDQSVVFEEAKIARAAQSQVGVDEVRTVDMDVEGHGAVRWSYGTMRLGGELDVRTAMRYVPQAIRYTPTLARNHRTGHALVILQIAKQIVEQLVVAHHKVAHLDLKPENVFVSPEGIARVGDWGTGQPLGGTPRDDGTHGFMPLEQYGHDSQIYGGTSTTVVAKSKSDMWSLGVLLLTALTGSNPFWSEYKLPCIRKLELFKAWEQQRFPQNAEALFTQDRKRDRVLLKEVVAGLRKAQTDFPDFIPLIRSLLHSNVDDRSDASQALKDINALWGKFDGDSVDWKTFWPMLSQIYRREDPTARAQLKSVTELTDAMGFVRDMYLAESEEA